MTEIKLNLHYINMKVLPHTQELKEEREACCARLNTKIRKGLQVEFYGHIKLYTCLLQIICHFIAKKTLR